MDPYLLFAPRLIEQQVNGQVEALLEDAAVLPILGWRRALPRAVSCFVCEFEYCQRLGCARRC